jgi:COMPASS component SWD1
VQFNPRSDKWFLVCPMRHAAVLVSIEGSHKIVPMDDEASKIVILLVLDTYNLLSV